MNNLKLRVVQLILFFLFQFSFGFFQPIFSKNINLEKFNINCDVPSGLTATNITPTTATMNCNSVVGATQYTWRYKINGGTYLTVNSTSNTRALTGLTPGSTYQFSVKAVCPTGTSAYSANISFNTSPNPCALPTGMQTTNIGITTATFSWTAVSGAQSYSLQYRQKAANGTWGAWFSPPSTTSTTYNVTGLSGSTNCQWHVKTNCSGSSSSDYTDPSTEFTTLSACAIPVNQSTTSITQSSATLNWAAVAQATSYKIQYREKYGNGQWSPWVNTTTNPTASTYVLTNLAAGTEYNWQVKSVCSASLESDWSSPISAFTTVSSGCLSPLNATTSNITTSSALLSWTAVGGVTGYKIQYREKGTNGTWGNWLNLNATTNSYNLSSLNLAKEYQWQVKSICSPTLESAWSTPVNSFTTLACNLPTNPIATSITTTTAVLVWTSGMGVTSYKIQYREKQSNGSWGAWIQLISATNSFSLNNLTPDKDYQWQVKSVCSGGLESSWTDPISTFTTVALTCLTPSNPITVNIKQTSATFKWSLVSGVSTYKIQYREKNALGIWGNWMSAGTSTTDSFNLTGLTPDKEFQWQVKSVCSPTLESAWSSPINNFSTLGCNEPSALATIGITTTSAILNWNAVNGVISYKIQYREKLTTGAWGAWIPLTSIVDSIIITNLIPDTDYQWQVKSVCSATLESSWTTPIKAFTTVALTCLTPSNLSTINIGLNTATINWSPVSGVMSYKIQYREKLPTGAWDVWIPLPAPSDSLILVGLTPDKNYQWQVKSVCSPTLEGSWSTPIELFTTLGCNEPINLTTTNNTGYSVLLNWTTMVGATSYSLQYRVKLTGGTFGNWLPASSNTNSYLLTGLTPETDYQWQVKSICLATLESVWSTPIANFSTINPCSQPTNLLAFNITPISALLKWNVVPSAISYILDYKLVVDNDWITVGVNADSFLLTGLSPDKKYVFRVKAQCNGIQSPFSPTPNPTFQTLPSNCQIPNNLNTTFVTSTAASFSWAATDSNFIVQYREKLAGGTWGNWISIPLDTNFVRVTGLKPSTDYQWRVKRICPPSLESDFSDFQPFTTSSPCLGPIIGQVTNLTQTTANLNWTVPGGPIGLLLFVGGGPTGLFVNLAPNVNTYNLTNLDPGTTYYFSIQAICLPQDTSAISFSNFTTVSNCSISTPIGLNELNIGTTQAQLNWTAVNGAQYYKIDFRKANQPNNWQSDTSVFTTKMIVGLTANTNYVWKIRAICIANQQSPFSADKTFKTLSSCAAPDSLYTTNITTTNAILHWKAVVGAVAYQYQISTNPNNFTSPPIAISTNSATANNLLANTTYYFKVRSICSVGDTGIYSIVSSFTTPAFICTAPIGLTTNGISSTKATLSWTKLSNPPTIAYLVCYKKIVDTVWNCDTILNSINDPNDTLVGIGADSMRIGFRIDPPFTYPIAGLMPNTEYEWKVKSICINGESSDYSNPTTKFKTDSLCGMVKNLNVVRIGFDNATLKWTNTGGDIQLFKIRYRKVGTSVWTTKYSIKDSIKISGLLPNTTYEFQVQTTCSSPDTSAYTASVNFTTLTACNFDTPKNLKETSVTSTTASLSWTSINGVNFELSYKKINDPTFTTLVVTNPYILTGLLPNTTYVWKLRNKCAIGYGDFSAQTDTFTTSCKLPDSIQAISTNVGIATISWNAINIGAISYTIRYRKINTTNWTEENVIGNSLSLTGLENGIQYEYQIQTNCSANETSPWSSVLSFVVQTVCTMGATGLDASNITNNSAKLNWNPITVADGNIFNFYNILYRVDGSDPNIPASWTSKTSNTNSLQLNSLLPATKYYWKVNTWCSSGQGNSIEHSFTTLPGISNDCPVPTNISGVGKSLSSILVSWNAVPGTSGYKIQYSLTNGSNWTETTSTTNSITLTGLNEDKLYFFRVASFCNTPLAYSNWSTASSAYTFSQCNVGTVNTLYEWNLQQNTVELSWLGIVPTALNYEIRYKFTASPDWTWTAVTVGNVKKLLIGGLWSGTSYDWQIRPICANNGWGNWSVIRTFSTPTGFGGCGEGPDAIKVEKNADLTSEATVSWVIRGNPEGHLVKEKEVLQDGTFGTATNYSVRGNENSIILKGLKSDIKGYQYTVEVIADCGSDGLSTPAVINFQTDPKSFGSGKTTLTGININLKDIAIIPNPTKGIFSLNFNSEKEQSITINIYDITGKLIKSEWFEPINGYNKRDYNFTNLTSGLYYLELFDGKEKTAIKFVVFE